MENTQVYRLYSNTLSAIRCSEWLFIYTYILCDGIKFLIFNWQMQMQMFVNNLTTLHLIVHHSFSILKCRSHFTLTIKSM